MTTLQEDFEAATTVLMELDFDKRKKRRLLTSDDPTPYPSKIIGLIADKGLLGQWFRRYAKVALINESVSFVIDTQKDFYNTAQVQLTDSRASYYYGMYFRLASRWRKSAPHLLNLPEARFEEAVELFGPAKTSVADRKARQAIFLVYLAKEICEFLDRDSLPSKFYAHSAFKLYKEELGRTPVKYNPRKIVRFGKGLPR